MAEAGSSAIAARLGEYFKGRFGIFLVGAVVTAVMVVLYAVQPRWMESQDNLIYDFLLRSRGQQQSAGSVAIVDIDEKSLAALGQWPWPRYRLTILLGLLRQAGVKAVAMDMLLAEPDRTSPVLLERQFKDELGSDVSFTGLPEQLRDNDVALAKILGRGPFVLSYYFDFSGSGTTGEGCKLPPSPFTEAARLGAVPAAKAALSATGIICPLPVLLQAATSSGFMNSIPDADNVIRRMPLVISHEGAVYPSLALAAAMRALSATGRELSSAEAGLKSLTLTGAFGKKVIPLDGRGMLLLNYRGPGGIFPRISAADVLKETVDKAALAGKTVILGSTAVGMQDIRATPLDRAMPGAEIQATVVDMIDKGDFILRPDWAPALEFALTLVMGLCSAALLSRAKGLWLVATLAGLGAAMWTGSAYAMRDKHFFIQPLYPLATLALNFVLLTVFKFWREESQRRFIHGAFAHYLSPKVVDQIVASPDKLNLTGEEREITILFSDIRGFTSISEKLSPTQLVDMLHEYLTPMTRIITGNLGTLDKYIGDAIMAFWNAPLDVPGHRVQGLNTALAMHEELAKLNQVFAEKYGQTLKIGVGLNCGTVRVGNFGSQDLFSYTIIGDNVNLASRLEGLTKYYGLPNIVGQGLVDPSTEGFYFQEVDRVLVKGKHEPVTIYTVMRPEDRERRAAELDAAAKAIKLYQDGEFQDAVQAYENLLATNESALYKLYLERCQTLEQFPPGEDWNGVYEHKTK